MSEPSRISSESEAARSRLDRAMRRATPLSRLALPSRRSLYRTAGLYANVFALVVALGIPNGTLRRAAGDAMVSFDGAARQVSGMVAVSADYPEPVDVGALPEDVVTAAPVAPPVECFLPEPAPVAPPPVEPVAPPSVAAPAVESAAPLDPAPSAEMMIPGN